MDDADASVDADGEDRPPEVGCALDELERLALRTSDRAKKRSCAVRVDWQRRDMVSVRRPLVVELDNLLIGISVSQHELAQANQTNRTATHSALATTSSIADISVPPPSHRDVPKRCSAVNH